MKLYEHVMKGVYDHTLDTKPWSPPGVSLIAARRMWPTTRGKGTVVAVLDTGVDYNHPDLVGNILDGKSFVATEKDYMDYDGHGTHVAGTIAANNKILGVAPETKLIIGKVLNKEGFGTFFEIVNGIKWARNWVGKNGEKVNVINLSLGSPIPDSTLQSEILKAYNQGITVVCAAGNEGDINRNHVINYPAYYKETIAVGAIDLLSNVADFSNSNDRIDIVAPGVDTYSTYPNGKYVELSGTSMAVPHISGAVALIYSRHFKRFRKFPSPEWIKHLLHYQSIDLYEIGQDDLSGYGLFSFNLDGGKNISISDNEKYYSINTSKLPLKNLPFEHKGALCLSIEELSDILSCDSLSYSKEDQCKITVFS